MVDGMPDAHMFFAEMVEILNFYRDAAAAIAAGDARGAKVLQDDGGARMDKLLGAFNRKTLGDG